MMQISKVTKDPRNSITEDSYVTAPSRSARSSFTPRMRMENISPNQVIIGGASYHGRMSNIRRFFCLFVVFDFFFTILMWMISIVLDGMNINTAIEEQVLHYKMETSLFDIVAVAGIRFVVLIFFYGCLFINHWIIVAISTTGTCAFLVTKVFLYDWAQSSQPVFQVLLVLISFILVWGEAWVLDIMVVPQESYVRIWDAGPVTERSPLLHSSSTAPLSNETLSNFYTPLDSPTHSDDELESTSTENSVRENSLLDSVKSDGQIKRKGSSSSLSFLKENPLELTDDKIAGCTKRSSVLLKKCFDYLVSKQWKTIRITGSGDVISVMYLPKLDGTFLKITGTVDMSADKLLTCLHNDIESSPTWNTQIIETRILYVIDDNTDLTYQAIKSPEGDDPKDYIILRHRGQCEPYYLSCNTSYNLPIIPVRKKYTRTEGGVSCFASWNSPKEHSSKCQFAWITNANLHGWIPQRTVHISLIADLEKFMTSLRYYIHKAKQ